MNYYTPPFSDFPLSRIALGCMSFHDLAAGRAIIGAALDLGINFFDTADLYDKGENERIVGRALQGLRQKVFIATKVGNRWKEDGSGWDWVPRRDYILQAVDQSLLRLQTDYIDLYQLHGGTIDDPLEEVINTFEELKKVGKIRAYGISSIRPNVVRKWTEISEGSTCMSQYSLLDRRPEEFILDRLAEAGQYALVRGALAKGLLAGKPARSYLEHDERAVKGVQQLLQDAAWGQPVGLALDFALRHRAIGSVVLGASKASQLQEAISAWENLQREHQNWPEMLAHVPTHMYQQHR